MRIFNKKNGLHTTGLALLIATSISVNSFAAEAQTNPDIIRNSRSILEKWIETEKIISKESNELELSKQMLNNRIELLAREIDSLKARITESQQSIAEADKKRYELINENEKLKESSQNLVDTIKVAEQRLLRLLQSLPVPIQERVEPLSQRLPKDNVESKLTLSERFQNVVGILNEIDKFNRDISVISELRELSSGDNVEVVSMYVGIGQSYYVNNSGEVAGVGSLSDDRWQWREYNSVASLVAEAVAILKNEKMASFVKLPAKIK